ncbi:MAG: hypothetical protein EOM28_12810 [Clostridia bacterium]|nr:hypothetical protein [Clostridia bacterium]
MKQEKTNSLKDHYEVALMVISVLIIIALVVGLTLFPEQGTQVAGQVMKVLTHTFGSTMQIITAIILLFLRFYVSTL